MSIPTTTIPAARDYLFTQLTAAFPQPVLVCYDHPGPNQPDDIISVGDVHQDLAVNSQVGSGGAGWLEERYTVEVDLRCYRGGDDAQSVFARAVDMVNGVVNVVRSDPSLGGVVLVAKPKTVRYESEWDEAHLGRITNATVEIECYQRI